MTRLSRRRLLAGLAALVAVELLLLVLYDRTMAVTITQPRYLLYPFVWINAVVLAVALTRPPAVSLQTRAGAAVVALAYFLLLTYVGGVFALMGMRPDPSVSVVWLSPGWGPLVQYSGPRLSATVVPYTVVGYAGLSYLVYVTVLDARAAAAGGLVALLSCVSCTLPVLASLLAGVTGGATAVASAAVTWSYDLSTLVFLVAVAVLYWRPSAGDLARRMWWRDRS